MSLHLIESRPTSRALVLRRAGGNMASVVMHGGLVTLAVLATSTPPSFAFEKPERENVSVYVNPPEVHVNRAPATQAPSNNSPSPVAAPAPFIAPVTIPVDIPAIPDVATSTTDFDSRAYRPNTSGIPGGSPTGVPGGSVSGNDVFNEPQVDRAVMLLPGTPIPRYPENLRSAGIQDTVVTSFVVDAAGKVEIESIHFPASTHVGFSNAITESLRRSRFRPAEVAGRTVRQKVEQAFIFSIAR